MSLQIKRGTNAQRLTITPSSGELVYTTDTKQVYVGDGSTVGGTPLSTTATANAAGANTQVQFNNANTFGASANFTFNTSTNTLSATNLITASILNTANISTANLQVTTKANLGAVANVQVLGGSVGQLLRTDGAGNLSWVTGTNTPAGANGQVQFNLFGSLGASANFVFDGGNANINGNLNLPIENEAQPFTKTLAFNSANGTTQSFIGGRQGEAIEINYPVVSGVLFGVQDGNTGNYYVSELTSSAITFCGSKIGIRNFIGTDATAEFSTYTTRGGKPYMQANGFFVDTSPSPVQQGDIIGQQSWYAYGGPAWGSNVNGKAEFYSLAAQVSVTSTSNLANYVGSTANSSTMPGSLQFSVGSNTANTSAQFTFNGNGLFVGNSISGNLKTTTTAPVAATSPGQPGQIAYASGFVYICVASNTWQRATLTTF